ncbi:probable basic-leucine zipper transcription factor I [Procambarus clarkii]|uniref:probable basic-leucine zipper transcription factor I n=1 Tax=Procambarus clarkii TaxID=6728 RepID=UPI001E671BD7|nr:DNA translocase FtsK-like [Procambarus clarkii]
MLLRMLVLTGLVGSALPLLPPPPSDAVLKKYSFLKIMTDCIGEASVTDWIQQLRSACVKCYDDPTSDIAPDFHDILEQLRLNSYRRPIYVPVPVYEPLQQPPYGQLPQYGQPQLPQFGQPQLPQYGQPKPPQQFQPQYNQSQLSQLSQSHYKQPPRHGQLGKQSQLPQPQYIQLSQPSQLQQQDQGQRPQHSQVVKQEQLQFPQVHTVPHPVQYTPFQSPRPIRSKREAARSTETIKLLKERLTTKISNITCVLRELKLLGTNNLPNYAYIGQELLTLDIDDGLKADLGEALETCRDFSLCLPHHKAKHPVNKELGTTMAFLRCMAKKKVAACMRADFYKQAEKMGWEDPDDSFLVGSDLLAGSDDPHTLMDNIQNMIIVGAELEF